VYLAGQVDAWFSAFSRVALATCVFIPFLVRAHIPKDFILKLMVIGGVQLGLMYGFYYHSFLFLSVPEVLLFTVMTPVYITLLNDVLDKQFNARYLLVAVIAVIGAVAIRYENLDGEFLFGLFLVQGANLCFATGQVTYKRLMQQSELEHKAAFGWFFVGAFVVSLLFFLLFGNTDKLPTTQTQWGILIYLGLVASGFGYFAWNKGATLVDVGALAVMNNVLIPAGIIVNLVIWNRDADLIRLTIGGGIILLALWVNQKLAPGR